MRRKFFPIFLAISLLAPRGVKGQQTAKLDTTTFIVVGEGLAAGMANYGLMQEVQDKSFPAQIARQMKTAFPQPLIQGPGLGDVLGYQALPVRVPTYPATTVRVFPTPLPGDDSAPTLFVFNLSVPGMKAADSLTFRPSFPLIQKNNRQQTVVNMILGFPSLILDKDVPLWSQVEYAEAMNPTLVLVELGYAEALEAAAAGEPDLVPVAANFRETYAAIVKRLRATNAEVIVTTIPDPIDTAYFTSPATAASMMRASSSTLLDAYGLTANDLLTRNALSTIGNGLSRGGPLPALPPGSILRAAAAADIRTRVRALNTEIANIAHDNGAVLYDLQAFVTHVQTSGVQVGSARLTADYLGGFYSLDGVYPGVTGHALIANDILTLINKTYGTSFAALDVGPIFQADPTTKYQLAPGASFAGSEVSR